MEGYKSFLEREVAIHSEESIALESKLQRLRDKIEESQVSLSISQESLHNTQREKKHLADDVKDLSNQLEQYENTKLILKDDISDLNTYKKTLENDIEALEGVKSTWTDKMLTLDEEYSTKKQGLESDLANINAKLDEVTVIIEDKIAEDTKTRTDLATWEHALQERDANLRRRENKVSDGENKITRNSNLLKL